MRKAKRRMKQEKAEKWRLYHFLVSFVIKESRERSMGARQNFSTIICFACKWDETVSAFNLKQFSREEHNNIGEGW